MRQKPISPFELKCTACSKDFDAASSLEVCECSGLIDVRYDLASIGSDWLVKDNKSKGLIRYSKLLPLANPSAINDFAEFFNEPTPLHKSEGLGKYLKLSNLWLKDETKNYSNTFKARDATISVLRFQEIGLLEFVLCSTGNTAAAFCHAMPLSRKPMIAHLFFPQGTILDFVIPRENVAKIEFARRNYQDTIEAAKQYAFASHLPYEGGFGNLGRREGCKTLAFEIAESEIEPDWYVQAIGAGTGAYAFHKGFSELKQLGVVDEIPRVLCVQPERCSPIVDSFRSGSELLDPRFVVSDPDTFATTLSNGNPWLSYPYVRRTVLQSRGEMEKVSETEMARALIMLFKLERLACDPAVGVALAGLMKSVDEGRIGKDSKIVLNVSGGLRSNVAKT